jgi:hypothetical protein
MRNACGGVTAESGRSLLDGRVNLIGQSRKPSYSGTFCARIESQECTTNTTRAAQTSVNTKTLRFLISEPCRGDTVLYTLWLLRLQELFSEEDGCCGDDSIYSK